MAKSPEYVIDASKLSEENIEDIEKSWEEFVRDTRNNVVILSYKEKAMWYQSLKFWEAVSWLLAGVAGLLVYFGVVPSEFGYAAPVVLAFILTVLKFVGINPSVVGMID